MALVEINKSDNLIADANQAVNIQLADVLSGEGKLSRGTILCYKSAIGDKHQAYKSALESHARYILAEDIDATSSDVTAKVIASGNINEAATAVKAGSTLSEVGRDALRNAGIFLVNGIAE